jgi:hypothetical protein
MMDNQHNNTSSSSVGASTLDKLLPKSISAKRRRRKEKQARDSDDNLSRDPSMSSQRPSTLGSEDTTSSATGDDEDHDQDYDYDHGPSPVEGAEMDLDDV